MKFCCKKLWIVQSSHYSWHCQHYARNELVETSEPQAPVSHRKPRIVVHIGATKTGSTYIQHFLEKNRPALLRAGVWFPEIGLYWQSTRPHKQAGHSKFSWAAVNNHPGLREHIEAGLALMKGKVHTIVLSSEAFFLHEYAHRIAEYFSGYSVEMVAYLRRQDEWANAQYCEFVAGGAVGRVDIPFAEWLKLPETQRRLDYRVPLSAWVSAVGAENVNVRVFEKAQLYGNDLLTDFAEATKLPILLDLPEPVADDRNSARLSAAHVELIRIFNSRPFYDRDSYFNFIEDITRKLQAWRADHGLPMPKPWVLSEEVALEIMANAEAVNREIASTYLGRKEEILFGPASPVPESTILYSEELTLVSEAYERAKPSDVLALNSKLDARMTTSRRKLDSPRKSKSSKKGNQRQKLLIMGFWLIYWVLTPVLATVYARRAKPEKFRKFLSEPAEFARNHWAKRHPFVTGLIYPNADPMGPFRILRAWKPVMRKFAKITGRARFSKAAMENPILFARTRRNPLKRAIGRLMFPCGELR